MAENPRFKELLADVCLGEVSYQLDNYFGFQQSYTSVLLKLLLTHKTESVIYKSAVLGKKTSIKSGYVRYLERLNNKIIFLRFNLHKILTKATNSF